MSNTLHVDGTNFRAFKILIAAEYNGMNINVPEFKGDAAFKALSPMGRVPVLETSSGCITSSNAIARYVGGSNQTTGLNGATYFESAQVDSWMDFATNEIETSATVWYYPAFGYMDANAAAIEMAKKNLTVALTALNKHLADKTYLVGNAVTLADISVASALVYPFKFVADASFRMPFANVMRWFDLCVHQPQFQAIIGDVTLCKTEIKADATPITVTGKKGGNKNKGGDKAPKEKKEKAKKEPAPKKEKPAAVEEEAPKPKPKEKHAFQIMDAEKPSPFVMDEWKRAYSNCGGDYKGAMDTFWSMYDNQGWSLFRGDYEYNEENKKLFMTSNLIGGFIQRTEEIRKWLFGTMTIRGKEGDQMKVSCYYLIRGDSIEPLIKANDDAAYYGWTKLPAEVSAEEKQRIYDYWCSDGPLDGEECLDSRVYK